MKFSLSLFLMMAAPCWASLSITSLDSPVVINFDDTVAGVNNGQFSGGGFQSSPTVGQLDSDAWAVTGWSNGNLSFGGTQTTVNTDYTRGSVTAAQTTGGIYAFGSANRQLMIQPGGGDWAPGTITLRISNDTGAPVHNWILSYDLFVRNDQPRSNSFVFSYSTNGADFITTGLTNPLFNYASGEASDALGWVNVGTPAATISASVLSGANLYIRWSGADVSGSGSRDEFGLDNISITAVPEPGAALLGSFGLLAILRRRRV